MLYKFTVITVIITYSMVPELASNNVSKWVQYPRMDVGTFSDIMSTDDVIFTHKGKFLVTDPVFDKLCLSHHVIQTEFVKDWVCNQCIQHSAASCSYGRFLAGFQPVCSQPMNCTRKSATWFSTRFNNH